MEKYICNHEDCPYKYCDYHTDYDEKLDVICWFCVPENEERALNCNSYLDI